VVGRESKSNQPRRRLGGEEEEEEGEAGLGEEREWGAVQDDADTRCDASTPFCPSADTDA